MKVLPDFVNLAKTPEQIEESHSPMAVSDYAVPLYPYGTAICLETEQLEKLQLGEDPEVGDLIHFQAIGRVTSSSSNETDKGVKRRVEIQITDIALEDNMEDDENEQYSPKGKPYANMYHKG